MEKIIIRYVLESTFSGPEKKHSTDAGWDLRVIEPKLLSPRDRHTFSTGLFCEIPEGYEIEIRPRSGLASKYGIQLANTPATVDSGYRGEVKVCLINQGDIEFQVQPGMRVAQLIINKVEPVVFQKVESLSDSERGSKGFGSTGTN